MTKWKLFLSIFCSFVVGALTLLAILVYVPRTTELDYNMRGFVISTDGQILDEFNMTATGAEYDFIVDRPNGVNTYDGSRPVRVEQDTFYLDIQWDSSMISKNATYGLFTRDFYVPNLKEFIIGDLLYYYSSTGLLSRECALFDSVEGVFYMYADELAENAFILGITDPDADPLDMVKRYQSVEGLLHRPELLPPVEN